jgi:hypothetical protein
MHFTAFADTEPEPEPVTRPEVEAHEWQRAQASLELARATRQPMRLCEALIAMARCERRSGWAEDAADTLDEALRWARTLLNSRDLLADLLCERGELAADMALDADSSSPDADPDSWLMARACAAEAAGLAASTSDPDWEIKLLLRASDLLNRLGCTGDAVAIQARAMDRQSRPGHADPHPSRAIEEVAPPTLH